MMKLISFLGIGDYRHISYRFSGEVWATPYVQDAITRLVPGISEVILLATQEAREKHKQSVIRVLEKLLYPPE